MSWSQNVVNMKLVNSVKMIICDNLHVYGFSDTQVSGNILLSTLSHLSYSPPFYLSYSLLPLSLIPTSLFHLSLSYLSPTLLVTIYLF